MIELIDIHKTYRMGETEVAAVRGVSLTIRQGEFVALMGPSGSGKSTLMHVLGLLDVPEQGSYRLGRREVATCSEDQLAALRRQTFGFVFQQFNLLPRMNALDNVALPLLYSQHRFDAARAEALLELVGLSERGSHRPSQLSGGQQQRVAIARSLVNDPALILADEPTGNLDTTTGYTIMQLLSDLHRSGRTVVVVTHDIRMKHFATHFVYLLDGRIVSEAEYDAASAFQGESVPQ